MDPAFLKTFLQEFNKTTSYNGNIGVKFEKYKKLLSMNEQGLIGNFNTVVKSSGLSEIHDAYRLTQEFFTGKSRNPHSHAIEYVFRCSLVYDRNQPSWEHLHHTEQSIMFKLTMADIRLKNKEINLKRDILKTAKYINSLLPPHMRTNSGDFLDKQLEPYHLTIDDISKFSFDVYRTTDNVKLMYELPMNKTLKTITYLACDETRNVLDQIVLESEKEYIVKEISLPQSKTNSTNSKYKQVNEPAFTSKLEELQYKALTDEIKQNNELLTKINDEAQEQLINEAQVQSIGQGVKNSFECIRELGRLFKNKDMIVMGTIGIHSVNMTMAVAKLTGSFGMAAVTGFACIEPYSAIALGAISIVSMLFGDNDSDGISEMIRGLYDALNGYFGQCFQNQKMIYEAIIENTRYMIEDFKVPVMDKLIRIETQLQSSHLLLSGQINNVLTQDLRKLITKLSEPDLLSKDKFLLNMNQLTQWIEVETIQPAFNGLLLGQDNTGMILKQLNVNEITHNYLGIFYSKMKAYLPDNAFKVVNVQVWQLASNILIHNLNNKHIDEIRRLKLERKIIESIQPTLDLLECIRSNKNLYNKFFIGYIMIISEVFCLVGSYDHSGDMDELFKPDTGKNTILNSLLEKLDEMNLFLTIFGIIINKDDVKEIIKKFPTRKSIMEMKHTSENTFISCGNICHNRGWFCNYHINQGFSIHRINDDLVIGSNFTHYYDSQYKWHNTSYHYEWDKVMRRGGSDDNNAILSIRTVQKDHIVYKAWIEDGTFKINTFNLLTHNHEWTCCYKPEMIVNSILYKSFRFQIGEGNVFYLGIRHERSYRVFSYSLSSYKNKGENKTSLTLNLIRIFNDIGVIDNFDNFDFHIENNNIYLYCLNTGKLLLYKVKRTNEEFLNQYKEYETYKYKVQKDFKFLNFKVISLYKNEKALCVFGYENAVMKTLMFSMKDDGWSLGKEFNDDKLEQITFKTCVYKTDNRENIIMVYKSGDKCILKMYDPLYDVLYNIPNEIVWSVSSIWSQCYTYFDCYFEYFHKSLTLTTSENKLSLFHVSHDGGRRYDFTLNPLNFTVHNAIDDFMDKFSVGYESGLKVRTGHIDNLIYSSLLRVPSFSNTLM